MQISDAASDGSAPEAAMPTAFGPGDGGCISGETMASNVSECSTGVVSFHVDAPTSWLYETSGDTNAGNWLTIHCPSGTLVDIKVTEDIARADCRDCSQGFGAAIGSGVSTVPPGGMTSTWDGTFFGSGTCPGSSISPMACIVPACAASGQYEAEVCLCSPDSSEGAACVQPTCMQTAFDYPSAGVVSLTFPEPADGAAGALEAGAADAGVSD